MNYICLLLTAAPLMNGTAFREAVTQDIINIENKYWKFSFRDITLDGEILHEAVAWDITELYSKTEELRRDNAELAELNERLKAYNEKINDVVRDREILQAKVNIHDEMNRLLLYTSAADSTDREALDNIFVKWQRDTLLLCMEAETDSNISNQLMQLAQLLGIKLLWNGELPEKLTEKQRNLFFITANEAITNAVKHADADSVSISFSESENSVCCIFENGGKMPWDEVRFTGGLANLVILAKEQNAELHSEVSNVFKLKLCFQKDAAI